MILIREVSVRLYGFTDENSQKLGNSSARNVIIHQFS